MSTKWYPIMHSDTVKAIPWDVLAPHEFQALNNHDQTLQRLAERGGLSPEEALAIIEGQRCPFKADDSSSSRLLERAFKDRPNLRVIHDTAVAECRYFNSKVFADVEERLREKP